MDKLYDIEKLIERYKIIESSDENKLRGSYWVPTSEVVKEKFRGQPRVNRESGKIPMLSWLSMTFWAQLLDFRLDEYYLDPLLYLKNLLKQRIFYFENIKDDNFMEDILPIYLGEGFEPTFFGMNQRYSKDVEPWLENIPVINNEDDADIKASIDTFSGGLMETAKRFYDTINPLLIKHGLRAGFPSWYHSPFHMTIFTHGFENTLFDMVERPGLVHKIMKLMVDKQVEWSIKRKEFTGIYELPPSLLTNDYVSVPNISPDMYKEFVFPYDREVSDRMGGIAYWHDCGDAAPYMKHVKELPGMRMIHSGPFTEFSSVARNFSDVPIEVHLKPMEDCMSADEETAKSAILKIRSEAECFNVSAYTIRVSCYLKVGLNLEENLNIVRNWNKLSQSLSQY